MVSYARNIFCYGKLSLVIFRNKLLTCQINLISFLSKNCTREISMTLSLYLKYRKLIAGRTHNV